MFSLWTMDGLLEPLDRICERSEKCDCDAMVLADEWRTVRLGSTGRGTLEEKGVTGKVDIVTRALRYAIVQNRTSETLWLGIPLILKKA